MLMDILIDSIDELEEYTELKKRVDNEQLEKRIEEAFLDASNKFNIVFNQIQMICTKTDFKPSKELLEITKYIVKLIQQSYADKMSNTEINIQLKRHTQILESTMRAEWETYYLNKTQQLIAMLNTVKEITPDRVYTQQVINRIGKGTAWTSSHDNIQLFKSGLRDGEEVVHKLQLNNKILRFIKMVGQGTVTIAQLDTEILEWIKKERLESKFLIKFNMVSH